ncbi:hypothetical protein ACJX0J_037524, partial [Zea mays]
MIAICIITFAYMVMSFVLPFAVCSCLPFIVSKDLKFGFFRNLQKHKCGVTRAVALFEEGIFAFSLTVSMPILSVLSIFMPIVSVHSVFMPIISVWFIYLFSLIASACVSFTVEWMFFFSFHFYVKLDCFGRANLTSCHNIYYFFFISLLENSQTEGYWILDHQARAIASYDLWICHTFW